MSDRVWTAEQAELFELGSDGRLKLPRVGVSADAGAGKTSVLVERIRVFRETALSKGKRILCVSFTEKSKADLEERLGEFPECDVHTIHGFCLRVASEFGARLGLPPILRIFDAEADKTLLKNCFERVYRRAPVQALQRTSREYLALCQAAVGDGGSVRVEDLELQEVPEFVGEVLGEYQRAKQVQGVVTYSDMEQFALQLLRQPEVASILRARYAHIFIDEFQDTSRVQCEIAERLAGKDTPLFVVGDKKQSIYRFRGANVQVFLEFVGRLENQRVLTANFRSHAEVIEAVNAVCAKALPEYTAMSAGRTERGSSAVWKEPKARVHRVRADSMEEGLLSSLSDLRRRGVSLSDTVLLLQRMSGAEETFAALRRNGISFVTTSSSTTAMHEGVRVLLCLWIWACEPWRKGIAFEAAVALGLSSPSELNQEWVRLQALQKEIWRSTCVDLLEQLDRQFQLRNRFGVVFEQFSVFVLRHQEKGLAPSDLAGRFTEMLVEGPFGQSRGEGFSEFFLLPPPPELSETLRVLTIHGSKGLEFPAVILGDAGARPHLRRQSILVEDEQIYLAGKDEKGESAYFLEMQQAFERKWVAEAEEKGRLLYVAMTRAKEALYLVDETAESALKAEKRKNKVPAWPDWIAQSGLPAENFPVELGARSLDQAPWIPVQKPLSPERAVLHRARHGVTELIESQREKPATRQQASGKAPDSLGRRDSAELGTLVHECLETLHWRRLEAVAKEERLDLSKFWSWRETPAALQIFGPHPDLVRAENEFAFEWKSRHGFVTGRVDRLVQLANGEIWIVDYKIVRAKTDLLSDYSPQLEIYRDAIRDLMGSSRVRVFLLDVLGRNASGQQLLLEGCVQAKPW